MRDWRCEIKSRGDLVSCACRVGEKSLDSHKTVANMLNVCYAESLYGNYYSDPQDTFLPPSP